MNTSRRALERRFECLLRENGAAISRLSFTYERVESVREELEQEIAMAIWQALPHFRGDCSDRTFVFRIAHNRGVSHLRKRRPRHERLDNLDESDEPVDPTPLPEQAVVQDGQRLRLMSAIRSLPVLYRQMIVLLLEGLSHAEIAQVMGITENNLAVRLTRARKRLKDALGEKT